MTTAIATDKARFQALMGNADAWMSIENLVGLCDREEFWKDDFIAGALGDAKKAHIRRLIKQLKDEDKWPLWASVETTNEEGETERVYKQELLFDPNDYRQVVEYHSKRASYHRKTAEGYAARCRKRFDVQLHLAFDDSVDPKKPR